MKLKNIKKIKTHPRKRSLVADVLENAKLEKRGVILVQKIIEYIKGKQIKKEEKIKPIEEENKEENIKINNSS
jgi:hypothetical protein